MGTDIHIIPEVFEQGRWIRVNNDVPDDRNYWAFAVLANVRNGSGFAGVITGDRIEPIDDPRGFPEDMSVELQVGLEDGSIWIGDHSFSYVTLAELLDYPLDDEMLEAGMVKLEAAEKLDKDGILPSTWCGWTSQEGWVQRTWNKSIRDAAWLIEEIIKSLEKLNRNPEHVRIIFGFDS